MPEKNDKSEFLPAIRRGRFDKLTIYEISESELEVLERGLPDSMFLNIAIFLLSSAISFTITLLTTDIQSSKTFIVFITFTIIAYIGTIPLGLLWFKNRQSMSKVINTIRKRLPPEGIAETIPPKNI